MNTDKKFTHWTVYKIISIIAQVGKGLKYTIENYYLKSGNG